MTLIQPTPPIEPALPTKPVLQIQPAQPSPISPGGIGARVLLEGRHARLDDVLHAVVVNALGPDSRVAVAGEDWAHIEDAIRGPVVAAARAALEQLAADLEADLPRRIPGLASRLGDHRLRAELGYD